MESTLEVPVEVEFWPVPMIDDLTSSPDEAASHGTLDWPEPIEGGKIDLLAFNEVHEVAEVGGKVGCLSRCRDRRHDSVASRYAALVQLREHAHDLDAGLRIEALHEYPYSNGYAPFEGFRRIEGNRFIMPEDRPAIPMMLGVVATK